MRELNIGTKKYTKVFALDDKGAGNANHDYEIRPVEAGKAFTVGRVVFQNGPIKEKGVNGVANEDLIAIVIDRLEGFQAGDYACPQNEQAIVYLRFALEALRNRTGEREERGVEGTSEK